MAPFRYRVRHPEQEIVWEELSGEEGSRRNDLAVSACVASHTLLHTVDFIETRSQPQLDGIDHLRRGQAATIG